MGGARGGRRGRRAPGGGGGEGGGADRRTELSRVPPLRWQSEGRRKPPLHRPAARERITLPLEKFADARSVEICSHARECLSSLAISVGADDLVLGVPAKWRRSAVNSLLESRRFARVPLASVGGCFAQEVSGRDVQAFSQRDQFVVGDVPLAALYPRNHRAANGNACASQAIRKQYLRKLHVLALPRLAHARSNQILRRSVLWLLHRQMRSCSRAVISE